MNIVFLIIAVILLTPTHSAHAIPPPDLLIAASQSLLSTLGVITASLVILLGSVRVYFTNLLAVPYIRFGAYCVAGVAGVLLIAFLTLYQQNQELTAWQAGVDQELREAWKVYDGVYNTPDELAARKALESAATEVTWEEFQSNVDGRDYLIVDLRDIHAYENGQFAGSRHIRFADLLRGRWEELTEYTDTPILLVCYLGTTGAIAGDFLAAKGFTELYQPKDGLRTMVQTSPSLPFTGITFTDDYFTTIQRLSLTEAQTLVTNNVHVIDLRNNTTATNTAPFATDSQFYREFATFPEIEDFVATLDTRERYLMLCNSGASCYQGEMLFLDLKKKSLISEGIYDLTKPDGEYFERPENFMFY